MKSPTISDMSTLSTDTDDDSEDLHLTLTNLRKAASPSSSSAKARARLQVLMGPAGAPCGKAVSTSTQASYAYSYVTELDLLALDEYATNSRTKAEARKPENVRSAPALVPIVNTVDKTVAFNVQTSRGCTLHDSSGKLLYHLCHEQMRPWPRYVVDAATNLITLKLRYRRHRVEVFRYEDDKTPWFTTIPAHTLHCIHFRFTQTSTKKLFATFTRHGAPDCHMPPSIILRTGTGVDAALMLSVALIMLGERECQRVPAHPNPTLLARTGVQAALLPQSVPF